MDKKFADLVEALAPKLAQLLAMSPLAYASCRAACPNAEFIYSPRTESIFMWPLKRSTWQILPPLPSLRDASSGGVCFPACTQDHRRTMRSYKQDENRLDALIELPEFMAAFVAAKSVSGTCNTASSRSPTKIAKRFWKSIVPLCSRHLTTTSRRIERCQPVDGLRRPTARSESRAVALARGT